jgi:hypothetical protein
MSHVTSNFYVKMGLNLAMKRKSKAQQMPGCPDLQGLQDQSTHIEKVKLIKNQNALWIRSLQRIRCNSYFSAWHRPANE